MSTLADFLLARIAELEAAIRLSFLEDPFAEEPVFRDLGLSVDAALLLARCAADRAIVVEHEDEHFCTRYHEEQVECRTLQLLAAPHASHPDYQQEWAL